MLSAVYAFAFSILLFALSAEATTPFLEVVGVIAAIWLAIAGAIVGWREARK